VTASAAHRWTFIKEKAFTPVAPGSYTSAAIIMLTDGRSTTGVDPLEAAEARSRPRRARRSPWASAPWMMARTIGFEAGRCGCGWTREA
jgi:Ca-activated chloride channel family protein